MVSDTNAREILLQETTADILGRMTREEIFQGVDFAKVEERKADLKQAGISCAVTSIGPAYIMEKLWPKRTFGKTNLQIEELSTLERIWCSLSDTARKIIGKGTVSEEMGRVTERQDYSDIVREAILATEALAIVGQMDFHFQETDETFPGTLTNYWEPLIVLAKKLGVEQFSLHTPYLRNRNLEGTEGGESALYNCAQVLISGFISNGEVDRLRAEAIADGRSLKGLVQDRATSTERLFTDWLGEEKGARAQEAFEGIKKQIDWFRKMKDKHGIKGSQITVHMASVGDEGVVELNEEDFSRGLEYLKQLTEYAGEDIELLVETQGLSRGQWPRVFAEIPNQKIVFDIAHVKIESRRYGDLFAALAEFKDRIGVIHFSQSKEIDGTIMDTHDLPSSPGVISEEEKAKIIKFAIENKIWVTFESGFTMADVQKIEEWARAELPKSSN